MWKKLDLNDASAILKLRDCVLSNLNHPDEYVREDDETSFVGEHLGEFGVSFGSFENNTLVAYCALTTDLYGSREIREFEVCAPRPGDLVLAAGMVHPNYRGRGLQREAIRIRVQEAEKVGASRLLAQVSPRNTNSLQNLFSEGFQCTQVASYRNGRFRLILSFDLCSQTPPNELIEDVSLILVQNFSQIRAEIENRRKGYRMVRSASGDFMVVGA